MEKGPFEAFLCAHARGQPHQCDCCVALSKKIAKDEAEQGENQPIDVLAAVMQPGPTTSDVESKLGGFRTGGKRGKWPGGLKKPAPREWCGAERPGKYEFLDQEEGEKARMRRLTCFQEFDVPHITTLIERHDTRGNVDPVDARDVYEAMQVQ